MSGSRWSSCIVVLALLATATNTQACAVCFGDPDSPMSKGVVAGVFVLLGAVVMVLVGVAGTSLFWVHRGRRLSRPAAVDSPRD